MAGKKPQQPNSDEASFDRANASRRARIQAARESAATFCELVLRDEFTGRPIALAPYHEEWHDLCSTSDRTIIWSHLESGKTNQISVGRLIWEIGRNPNIRGAVVSNTQRQAEKIVAYVGKYIQSSPEVKAVFPDLKPGQPWTQAQLTVERPVRSKDPTIQALGLHGNIVGARLDFVLIDDILDFENTQNARHREDTWAWYHAALSGRLTKAAWVRILGNAWHHDDMMFRLSRSPGWTARAYPILLPDGTSAWPDRWSPERIEAKRQDLTPFEFARQMMCQPRTLSDTKFQEDWIRTCIRNGAGLKPVRSLDELLNDPQWVHVLTGISVEDIEARDTHRRAQLLRDPAWREEHADMSHEELRQAADAAVRLQAGDERPRFRLYTGVDLAVGRESGHESVLFTVAQCADGKRRPVEIVAGRWPGPEIIERIVDVHDRYGSVVICEDNAAQTYIIQFARERDSSVPIIPFTTGAAKLHPEMGVESIAAEFAAGKWGIPNINGKLAPEFDKWVRDLMFYDPHEHTPDRIMASWFVRDVIRRTERRPATVGVRVIG